MDEIYVLNVTKHYENNNGSYLRVIISSKDKNKLIEYVKDNWNLFCEINDSDVFKRDFNDYNYDQENDCFDLLTKDKNVTIYLWIEKVRVL